MIWYDGRRHGAAAGRPILQAAPPKTTTHKQHHAGALCSSKLALLIPLTPCNHTEQQIEHQHFNTLSSASEGIACSTYVFMSMRSTSPAQQKATAGHGCGGSCTGTRQEHVAELCCWHPLLCPNAPYSSNMRLISVSGMLRAQGVVGVSISTGPPVPQPAVPLSCPSGHSLVLIVACTGAAGTGSTGACEGGRQNCTPRHDRGPQLLPA